MGKPKILLTPALKQLGLFIAKTGVAAYLANLQLTNDQAIQMKKQYDVLIQRSEHLKTELERTEDPAKREVLNARLSELLSVIIPTLFGGLTDVHRT